MGTCNIDHTVTDVLNKLESQEEFLPEDLIAKLRTFLTKEQAQHTLNEVFHLLKKYDLVAKEEQEERNQKLQDLLD